MNLLRFYRLGRKPERKKTFWSENAIKSLDSLGFSGLGRVIRNKDLFFRNENKTNENSALFRHSFLTDHVTNYSNLKILARDNNSFRLQIKETLKIKEYCAHNSLNANLGSFKLSLWCFKSYYCTECYTCTVVPCLLVHY